MDRRRFLEIAALGAAGAGLPASAASAQGPSVSRRPNFLFMICDDLMFRTIHALNNREVHTPNMDRLVAKGCAFTHSFHQGSWTAAVCIASRTMLNSGLTGFRAQGGIDHVRTWGQAFGNAGYDTYLCGKWHLDPTVLQRSFKELGPVGPGFLPSTPIDGAAYDRPRPGDTWEPWDESLKGHWIHTGLWRNAAPDRIEHAESLYTDAFIDHLTNKAAKRDTPFFMYLGFNSPHDPRQSPREYVDMYPREKIEIPPDYLPVHPFDQGDFKIRDEVLAPFPRTREAVQLHRREYYALITYVDAEIGRVLDALERSGKADNTYVILTADHGLAVGEHGLMGKQNLYDCSVRMPLIVAGPGITAGRRVDQLVYQHCMYATTCELAGIQVPESVEFPSLAPLLRGGETPIYDEVFSYYIEYQRMIRTPTHKLIAYPHIYKLQLFEVQRDPWETHDLADDPASDGIKKNLMARMVKMQQELDDPLKLWFA